MTKSLGVMLEFLKIYRTWAFRATPHTKTPLRACLHGGGGPQVGEVTRFGGYPPVHIISHFNLITFT